MLQKIKDRLSHKETVLCCGSLVLQKHIDVLSFSNGPTFAVLECFGSFHYSSTTQLLGQGMRNEVKRVPAITRGEARY